MSTTTTFENCPFCAAEATPREGLFARLMAARMRHGRARVQSYLARQSDEKLAGLGFEPEQIAHIRSTGEIPANFWG